ncbi:MAG: DUF4175 family protein [Deltaproteobacteria bacterium]|nr:DUF4175 family protein [Deltaproteobacteria bacterium]
MTTLWRALRAARRALRQKVLLYAALTVPIVIALATLSGIVGSALGGGPRVVALVQVVVGGGGLVYLFVRHVALYRSFRETRSVAVWLDRALLRRQPGLESRLLSAVELARDHGRFGESRALSDLAILQAATVVGGMDRGLRALVWGEAWPGLRRRIVGLLTLGVAMAAVYVFASAALHRSWASLLALGAGRGAFLVTLPDPRLSDLKVTYKYPAYTGRSDRIQNDGSGDIVALPGTEIVIDARTRYALASATLVVGGSEAAEAVYAPTDPDMPRDVVGEAKATVDDRRLRASFVVSRAGRYRFRATDLEGQHYEEIRGHEIYLERDDPPEVSLLKPVESPLEVNEHDRIDVAFEVVDDFGLNEAALAWRVLGTNREGRVRLPLPARDDPRHRSSGTFDLSKLGLKPGDRVAYTVEALDNDTINGPKVGSSRTLELRVYSKDEHHREVLAIQSQALDELVHILADNLESPFSSDRPTDQDVYRALLASAHRIVERATAADALLRRAALAIKADPLGRPEVASAFEEARRRLFKDTKRKKKALLGVERSQPKKLPRFDIKATRRVVRSQATMVSGLEKNAVYLADLLNEQRMTDAERLVKSLREQQNALREAILAYRDAPDAEKRRQIAETIRDIKAKIREIGRELGKLSASIPQDLVNQDALESEDSMKMMDDVEKMMEDGDLDRAMAQLDRMLSASEEMIASLQSGRSELSRREYSEITERAQKIWDDLSKLESNERRMAAATEAIAKNVLERMKSRLGNADEFVQQQLRRLGSAKKNIDRARPPPIFSAEGDEFDVVARRLDDAERAFLAHDFGSAKEMVELARDNVGTLERDAHRRAEYARRFGDFLGDSGSATKAEEELRRTAPILEEILQDLDRLMPPPESLLQGNERKELERHRQRQSELAKDAERLGRALNELGEQLPIVGPEVTKMLEEAKGAMNSAEQGLGAGDAPSALGHERRAADALKQLGQELENAADKSRKEGGGQDGQDGQGGQGGGIPVPFGQSSGEGSSEGTGSRNSTLYDRVQIPQPEQYKAPAEFREDILDAAKRGTVERFKDVVREYYEELVK